MGQRRPLGWRNIITTESGWLKYGILSSYLLQPLPVPFSSSYLSPYTPESALLTTDLSNIPSTDHHTLLSGTYFNLSSGTSFLTLKRVRVAWFLKPTQLLIRPFLTHHDFPISL